MCYSDTTNVSTRPTIHTSAEDSNSGNLLDKIPTSSNGVCNVHKPEGYRIQDSGARREFESGAVRDIVTGKGRCDLVPLSSAAIIIFSSYSPVPDVDHMKRNVERYVLEALDEYMIRYDESASKSEEYLSRAVQIFLIARGWTKDDAFLEVSKHYEEGALKYGEYNWQKGIPCHSYIDSAIRHLMKWCRGDNDEPHDRAFLWNILSLHWTTVNHPELVDY